MVSVAADPWRTMKALVILAMVAPTFSDKYQEGRNRSSSIVRRRFADEVEAATQPPCGSCKMREEIKNRNLEVIKGEVLRRMGFQTAPNVTGRVLPPVPPHFLAKVDLEMGAMQSDEPMFKTGYSITEEEDDYHVKTQEVLTFAQPYPRLRHGWRGQDILHFMFSDSITKYHVSNATLFVYVKGAERRPLPDVLIEVFKVYKAPDHPDSPGLYRMVSKKVTQPLGRGDWVKLDLTITVSEWFKNPRENFGFVVNATANGKKVVVTDTTVEDGSKAPFVEVSTMEARRRTRRNVGLNCDDKMNEPLCCRYPLIVDFEEFGWDFIIAPKRYDAHYCSGECPYITLQKHAHTHLMKIASPNSAQPCCAPRKMSAISMLYFDQQLNVVYGSLPGMVVDRCGCS
ncbi:growth/differentiation factor 8 [Tenebrio molitor]|uniref:growth/differentiation factor 8 n=1 Tax=Tenebrio molitor TaxID=7067 RepID=UPI003624816D